MTRPTEFTSPSPSHNSWQHPAQDSDKVAANRAISLPSGSLVAPSFAAGVLSALALGRRRRRRQYQPGRPRAGRNLATPSLAPTLRSLAEAYREETRQGSREATAHAPLDDPGYASLRHNETLALSPDQLSMVEIGRRDREPVFLELLSLEPPRSHVI